jgi:hypothetical protein
MLFVLKLFTGAGSLASQLNAASTAAVAIALLKKSALATEVSCK